MLPRYDAAMMPGILLGILLFCSRLMSNSTKARRCGREATASKSSAAD